VADLKPGLRSPWLSLGEASRILGITPGTLRRWADHGDVPAFVTPGGHRRFPRSTIESLLPPTRSRRPRLAGIGATAERVARVYRGAKPAGRPAPPPWLAALSEEERSEFRQRGHRLLALLLEQLNQEGTNPSGPELAEATASAAEYGRRAAAHGASLSETVEAFVRFRSAFTGELARMARRRGLDTREATALLVEAERAVDRLLVALMSGHSGQA
jgi:excisionase family DNA binding protein